MNESELYFYKYIEKRYKELIDAGFTNNEVYFRTLDLILGYSLAIVSVSTFRVSIMFNLIDELRKRNMG